MIVKLTDKFKRTPNSEGVVYALGSEGIQLLIDGEGGFSRLVVFPGNEVFIDAVQLMGRPIDAIPSELCAAQFSVDMVDAGLWCVRDKVLSVECRLVG